MRGIDVRVGRTVAEVEQVEPVEDGPEAFVPDPDYAGWSDEDVAAEYERVGAEHHRRQAMTAAQVASVRALAAYQAAQGISDGTAWREVTSYMDAVPPGQTRVFEGDLYRAVGPAPVAHSPAVAPDLWELVTEGVDPVEPDPDDHPEWSSDGVEYAAGDVVAYDGVLWEVAAAHTSQPLWHPTESYMWRRV